MMTQTIPAAVGLTNLPTATMTDDQLLSNIGGHLQQARFFVRRTAEETWAAGLGLFLLRDRRKKSKDWMQAIKGLGLPHSTANSLVKIGRAFDTVEEVRGRTVDDLKVLAGVYSDKEIERRLAAQAKPDARSQGGQVAPEPPPELVASRSQGGQVAPDPDPDPVIADELNRLAEKVALLLNRVGSLKSRTGIDLGKLKQIPADLRKVIKVVERLPEVAA